MCPECKEPLVVFELQGVELDRCLNCGGTWLDAGELEMITELSGIEPGKITRALLSARSEGKSPRRCPRCRRKLRIIHLEGEPPIELDRCPWGHGLWLDRGETLAVVRAFGEGEAVEESVLARFFSDLYSKELESPKEGE